MSQTTYIAKVPLTILGVHYDPSDPESREIADPDIPKDVIRRLISNRKIVDTSDPSETLARIVGDQPPPGVPPRRPAPQATPEELAWSESFVRLRLPDETQRAYLARRCAEVGISDTGTAAIITRRLIRKGVDPDGANG